MFLAYAFLLLSRRLVYDNHNCLRVTCYSPSTRLLTRYFWIVTRLRLVSPLRTFVIVSHSSLYI